MSNVVMALPATFISNHVSLAYQSQSQTREEIINSYRLMAKTLLSGKNEDSHNSRVTRLNSSHSCFSIKPISPPVDNYPL